MMHASRPAAYFEDAVLAWLDTIGGYESLRADGVDLVLARVTTDYRRPVRLGATVQSWVRVVSTTDKSLTLNVALRDADGDVLVESDNVYICVRDGTPAPVPGPLRNMVGDPRR
jgi:acyl-CoA thioesterase FadM